MENDGRQVIAKEKRRRRRHLVNIEVPLIERCVLLYALHVPCIVAECRRHKDERGRQPKRSWNVQVN